MERRSPIEAVLVPPSTPDGTRVAIRDLARVNMVITGTTLVVLSPFGEPRCCRIIGPSGRIPCHPCVVGGPNPKLRRLAARKQGSDHHRTIPCHQGVAPGRRDGIEGNRVPRCQRFRPRLCHDTGRIHDQQCRRGSKYHRSGPADRIRVDRGADRPRPFPMVPTASKAWPSTLEVKWDEVSPSTSLSTIRVRAICLAPPPTCWRSIRSASQERKCGG